MPKYLTDEEKSNIVLAEIDRLRQKRKNKHTWQETPLLLRRQIIIDLLGQGLSKTRIVEELMARWGVENSIAYRYVNDAYDYIAELYRDDSDKLKEIALSKLESLAEDAIASRDRTSALKAYDQINKLQGLYEEKLKTENKTSITFDFGGNDNL